MLKLFTAGNRTITLSFVALALALILQADAQAIIDLAPMLKLSLTMVMTLIVPLIPVYIRKAIRDTQKPGRK